MTDDEEKVGVDIYVIYLEEITHTNSVRVCVAHYTSWPRTQSIYSSRSLVGRIVSDTPAC